MTSRYSSTEWPWAPAIAAVYRVRPCGTSSRAALRSPVPLASVYPLVSTRSLARPFTYEVPEGIAKGTVVSVRLGRRRRAASSPTSASRRPEGVEPVARSGPARRDPADARRSRALARGLLRLDAGARARARRSADAGAARRAAVAGVRESLEGEPSRRRSPTTSARRSSRSSPRSTRESASTSCSTGRPAAARPRSTCRRAPRRSSAASGRSCSSPRSRSRRRPSGVPAALRRRRRDPPLVARRRGATRRARPDRPRGGADRRRRPVGASSRRCAGSA